MSITKATIKPIDNIIINNNPQDLKEDLFIIKTKI